MACENKVGAVGGGEYLRPVGERVRPVLHIGHVNYRPAVCEIVFYTRKKPA